MRCQKGKPTKKAAEFNALQLLVKTLPKVTAEEFLALWEEFEDHLTVEAKVAQATDKLEVIVQHNIAGIGTWDENGLLLNPYYKTDYFNFNQFLRDLKDQIDEETIQAIKTAGKFNLMQSEHQKMYLSLRNKR